MTTIEKVSKPAVNERQARFCMEYAMNGGNATQAYIAAGYKNSSSARVCASQLLTKPNIREMIAGYRKVMHDALMHGYEETLQEVSKLAFFDPVNLFDDNGNIKALEDMDDATRKSVQEISIGPDGSTKLRVGRDKRAYLDMMMKYYNAYEAHQNSGADKEVKMYLLYPEDAKA